LDRIEGSAAKAVSPAPPAVSGGMGNLTWRWFVGLALLVAGVRLGVFAYAGSPLPYYDQWVAEFNNVFLRVVHGNSPWAALFTPHNEHLIVTTRLASLGGFLLNGYWDVRVLVVVAALTRAAEAALIGWLLSRAARPLVQRATWAACAVVFVTPVSGYNLLCGLQTSFYLADLALVASLVCVDRWGAPSRSGILLIAIQLVGLLSMGSAVAIPLATVAMHVASGRDRRGFWGAWLACVAAVSAYALTMAGHPAAGAPIASRIGFLITLLGWPLPGWFSGVVVTAGCAALGVAAYRRAALARGALPAALALLVYASANVAMIAINRPRSDFHLRHWESAALMPLGVFVLFANAGAELGAARRSWRGLSLVVGGLYACALGFQVARHSWPYVAEARAHRAAALAYHRAVLTSGQYGAEAARITARLARDGAGFFDDPVLRFTPGPVVLQNIAAAPLPSLALLGPDILPSRESSLLTKALGWLVRAGPFVAAVGLAVLLLPLGAGTRKIAKRDDRPAR
jgi:hypothetical protein